MERIAMITGLYPEKVATYLQLHRNVWPEIQAMISECNIRNYSIFHRVVGEGEHLLFSYFEYVGDDFHADMAKMAADPKTQDWWALTAPCQKPVAEAELGGAWVPMDTIYRQE